VIVKGFKKCCISKTWDETGDTLWNGSEEEGMLKVIVYKMKALTVKMEIVDTDW
jgi:hypothetical protein